MITLDAYRPSKQNLPIRSTKQPQTNIPQHILQKYTSCDTFQRSVSFTGLSSEDVSFIQNIEGNRQYILSENGWTSDVYRYKDYVIKIPKNANGNEYNVNRLEPQKEFQALKYVEKLGLDNFQTPEMLIDNGQKYFLVTKFVSGKNPVPTQNPFTTESLTDLVEKLTKLDLGSIYNYDWQGGNILLKDGKAGLIDFAATGIYQHEGYKEAFHIDNGLPPQKPYKLFFHDVNNILTFKSSNPFFAIRSNVDNFEYRCFHHYLSNTPAEDKPLDLLKNYLKIKAKSYHTKMAEYLETFDPREIARANGATVEDSSSALENAIKHERLLAKLLANPTNEIAQIELAKMQFRYTMTEYPDQGCAKGVFNQITEILEGITPNENTEFGQYIKNTKRYFNTFKDYFKHNFEAKEINPQYNLLKNLFADIAEEVEQIPTTIKPTMSRNKILAIGGTCAAVLAGGIYYIKHTQNNQAEATSVQIPTPQYSNFNNSPVFSKFSAVA